VARPALLLVGEVCEQGVGKPVDGDRQSGAARCQHALDQSTDVAVLEFQPLQDRGQRGGAAAQMREHHGVFPGVMRDEHPTVGAASGGQAPCSAPDLACLRAAGGERSQRGKFRAQEVVRLDEPATRIRRFHQASSFRVAGAISPASRSTSCALRVTTVNTLMP